jgi:hypothetical protein
MPMTPGDHTARTPGTARPGAKPYGKKEGQPDPSKSVEDEHARRAAGASTPRGAPKVSSKADGASSTVERKSDKTWSRSGAKNQEERARR